MSSWVVRSMHSRASHLRRFQDKVALITASTSGIGLAVARRLGSEGAKVVICSRRQENVERALTELRGAGIQAEGVACHVSERGERQRLLQLAKSKFGAVDILISMAGVNPAKSHTLHIEESVWDKIFEVNVKNSWQLAKEVYPELVQRKGNIVFMGSVAAYQSSSYNNAYLGVYGAAKAALVSLTKALANELATSGVRVNCVTPGPTGDTEFGAVLLQTKEMTEETLSMVPMRRVGLVEEVAGAIAFLASEDAGFITGHSLIVSGGTPTGL